MATVTELIAALPEEELEKGPLPAKGFPVRMLFENRQQHLIQHLAAKIQRAELYVAVHGDDFERRARGGEIPARIPPWEFVSG